MLIGTTSIEQSEELSHMLDQANIPHSVLNAKYHEREAAIVALAGQKGAVTIATNMAGRGTDILWVKASQNLAGLPSSVRNDMKAAVLITSSVDVPAVRGIRVPASSSCLWKMTCSASLAGITSRALWKDGP